MTSVSALNGGTVQYSYDAAGNRVTMVSGGFTTGYNVNNLDQYTSAGGGAYGYDADGNMTSKQSGGAWTYTFDNENRLTAVSGPTGSWTYQYDALGNRMAQINGSTTTQYLVDPTGMASVVAEFGGSGNLVSHFTYGLGLTSSLPASGRRAVLSVRRFLQYRSRDRNRRRRTRYLLVSSVRREGGHGIRSESVHLRRTARHYR